MRYSQEIVIEQPRDRVVELFDSGENMLKWFPGLVSFEHVSGEPGTPGAKSKMVFKTKRGNFELIETITANDLPAEFSGIYDTVGKGMSNAMTNRFVVLSNDSTRYETEVDYTFRGWTWRVMSLFMGPIFRRQSFKVMKLFKEFAESQPRSAEPASADS